MNRHTHAATWLAMTTLVTGLAHAHHSVIANFDPVREVEIQATVVAFNYRNPHGSMVVDGIGYENGEALSDSVVRWEIETSAIKGLAARGITADTFQAGDQILIRGTPHRNRNLQRANSSNFLAPDGSALDLTRNTRPDPVQGPDLDGAFRVEGRWRPPFQRAGDQSSLPLNAAGNQAWLDYEQALSPANTCEPMSIPVVMNAPSYYVDIRFGDDRVVIFNEAYDVDRSVPLGDEFAPADPGGLWGSVRGRIEGDQLVVESKDYLPSAWGLGAATQINGGGADVPSSEQKTVTERFSTSEDGLELHYDYVLYDPVYMTREHSASIVLGRAADDAPMVAYDCNLDSARQFSRAPGESVLSTDD